MDADRTEMHDLSATKPDIAAQLAAAWDTWAKRTGANPWPWKKAGPQ